MTTAIRLVTLTLILSLTAGGPLAPALAQQPAQPAEPAQEPTAPAGQSAEPAQPAQPLPPAPAPPMGQPDLFQERMKVQRAPERHEAAYNVGAGVANAFLIPGRAITCVLGTAVGIAVLAVTLGSGYKAAAAVGEEGCGGKWIVTGEDLWPEPHATSGFDWEQQRR